MQAPPPGPPRWSFMLPPCFPSLARSNSLRRSGSAPVSPKRPLDGDGPPSAVVREVARRNDPPPKRVSRPAVDSTRKLGHVYTPQIARPEGQPAKSASEEPGWDPLAHPESASVPPVQDPPAKPTVAVGESVIPELRDGLVHGVGLAEPGADASPLQELQLLQILEESGVDVRQYAKRLDAQVKGERRHSTAFELQLTFHSAAEQWCRSTRSVAAESRSLIGEVRQSADVVLKQVLYLRTFVDLLRSQSDDFGKSVDGIRLRMERTIDAELQKTYEHAKKLDKQLADADARFEARLEESVDLAQKRVTAIFEQAQASGREAQQSMTQISQGATAALTTLQRVEQSVHAFEERSSHVERDMKQADRLFSGMAERFQSPVGLAAGFGSVLGAGIGAFLAVLLYMFFTRVG